MTQSTTPPHNIPTVTAAEAARVVVRDKLWSLKSDAQDALDTLRSFILSSTNVERERDAYWMASLDTEDHYKALKAEYDTLRSRLKEVEAELSKLGSSVTLAMSEDVAKVVARARSALNQSQEKSS